MALFCCYCGIAISRQWCLECILKFEDFAKTIELPAVRDLLLYNGIVLKNIVDIYIYIKNGVLMKKILISRL